MTSIVKNKVVFFDWNGTLSNSFFWEHMRQSEKEEIRKLYEIWDNALFKRPKAYIQDWMRGLFTTEDVLKEIAKETKTEYKLLLREFVKGCKSMTFVSDELPDIIKGLRSRGYYVVVATNNMDCFTRWTLPFMKLEDQFDEILNSFYLKGLKNDVKNGKSVFFADFFSKYDVPPTNCIFLDDSVDKDDYITRLGIKYIQIESSDDFLMILKSL
ncbi:haloacid dehalogenase-like hydrolase [Candidatus Dojkabacteria bacterium]|nr:haloacid dehalogenase-like hydrolase [Candidatus Dojkabacteria bacterium]